VDVDEKTAFFYSQGQFICAGESYNLGIAAKENYQSMGQSEIVILDKKKVETLLQKDSKFEAIGRIATENELIASQKIIASFVTQTAEERYLELLESNSELFQNVPQQYIASFLGVSPETLSRIKSRILKR
jgi:CRP-like cAMP-binding protein